eukprot:GHVT01010195.1.p1 GENE.GHVT01010195.1~~GHVT01010195.1.p1  ORF type:complete len:296 (-),score=55.79 GHVT01010195.1:1040-1927(-)
MPIVGCDWSHAGVAEAFSRIRDAGYHVLYLTARAIGQADSTRDYLFGLTQDQTAKLPDGPLVLSPDRLFPSFKREVIDRKPYVFKIAALRDMRHLFHADFNPFYAGFGNRESDHRAYVHVGIPESRVFIIDPKGTIHHVNTTYARTYATMSSIAEYMFPPLCGAASDPPASADEDQVRNRKLLRHTLLLDEGATTLCGVRVGPRYEHPRLPPGKKDRALLLRPLMLRDGGKRVAGGTDGRHQEEEEEAAAAARTNALLEDEYDDIQLDDPQISPAGFCSVASCAQSINRAVPLIM